MLVFLAVMQNYKALQKKKDPPLLSLDGLKVFLEKSTSVQFKFFVRFRSCAICQKYRL